MPKRKTNAEGQVAHSKARQISEPVNYPDSPEELAKALFKDADRRLDEKLKTEKRNDQSARREED